MMRRGNCRSCGRVIAWAKSAATGNLIPLDPEPDLERGNVIVDPFGDIAHSFKDRASALDAQDSMENEYLAMASTMLPHAASCPAACRAPEPKCDAAPRKAESQEAIPF